MRRSLDSQLVRIPANVPPARAVQATAVEAMVRCIPVAADLPSSRLTAPQSQPHDCGGDGALDSRRPPCQSLSGRRTPPLQPPPVYPTASPHCVRYNGEYTWPLLTPVETHDVGSIACQQAGEAAIHPGWARTRFGLVSRPWRRIALSPQVEARRRHPQAGGGAVTPPSIDPLAEAADSDAAEARGEWINGKPAHLLT